MRPRTATDVLAVSLALAGTLASCAKTAPSSPPVTPLPVSAASSPASPPAPPSFSSADLDRLLAAEWQKAGVVPAPPIDDARFVRRVWIDVAGVVPPPSVVTAYVADPSPDKKQKLVDDLLAGPHYADAWTNTWDRLLLGKEVRRNIVDRDAFRGWLRERLEKNAPWDRLVYDLVSATGTNTGTEAAPDGLPPNPAVNWLLRFENTADLSGTASRLFLGVQIQCAQCHDHKTEKWKMEDFQKLTACFVRTKIDPLEKGKMGPGTRRFEVVDLDKTPMGKKAQMMAGEFLKSTPTALDGTDFSSSANRRQALATWITSPDNPWFSDAVTNRLWAHFLGRGFVEPVDDIRPTNPATAPDVWKALSSDFVRSGYDLKHEIRLLVLSDAYARAPSPPSEKADPGKLWARFRVRPLGPDELVDSLLWTTSLETRVQKAGREDIEKLKANLRRQFNVLFDVDEAEEDDDTFDGTIQQLLLLLNGRLTNDGSSALPGTALTEILSQPGADAEKIKALYLRTLSRPPTDAELATWVSYVTEPHAPSITAPPPVAEPVSGVGKAKGKGKKDVRDPLAPTKREARLEARAAQKPPDARRQAYEDLFWALLNSSEFLFQH